MDPLRYQVTVTGIQRMSSDTIKIVGVTPLNNQANILEISALMPAAGLGKIDLDEVLELTINKLYIAPVENKPEPEVKPELPIYQPPAEQPLPLDPAGNQS